MVRATIVYSGTLDALDATEIEATKANLRREVAGRLNVDESLITVTIYAGSIIIVVDVIVPPTQTPEQVSVNLLHALQQASSVAGVIPVTFGTSTVQSVVVRPVESALPPYDAPSDDGAVIAIAISSVVGLFLFIFVARACTPERLREATALLATLYDRWRGVPPPQTTTIEIDTGKDGPESASTPASSFASTFAVPPARTAGGAARDGRPTLPPVPYYDVYEGELRT